MMAFVLAQTETSQLDTIIQILMFVLVFAIWLFGVFLWNLLRASRQSRVHERLGLTDSEDGPEERVLRLWKEGREITTTVHGEKAPSLMIRLEQLLHEAGMKVPAQTVVMFGSGLVIFVVGIVYILSQSILACIGAAVVVPFVMWTFFKQRAESRMARFETQFAESLELAARSLRAGHPLIGAFQLIAVEMSPPCSTLFAELCQLQQLGVSMENALRRMAAASSSSDLKLFSTSVIMQLKSGGNIAEMMGRLAQVIRDRSRLKRRVRVLTAQVSLSKRVLLVLPFMLLVVMYTLNPDYLNLLNAREEGRFMLVLAGIGLVLGAYLMRRRSVLKY